LKKIYTAINVIDAKMLQELLQEQGIETVVLNENINKIYEGIQYAISPELWVINDAEYQNAADLIEYYKKENDSYRENSGTWKCVCGEEVENIFTECWNCGKGHSKK
jgi:hypothetical protein